MYCGLQRNTANATMKSLPSRSAKAKTSVPSKNVADQSNLGRWDGKQNYWDFAASLLVLKYENAVFFSRLETFLIKIIPEL